MIKLGDKVKDSITGFSGIVIARCAYLNGCISIQVQPQKLGGDGKPIEPEWIDEQQLVDKSKAKAGGPQVRPPSLSVPG